MAKKTTKKSSKSVKPAGKVSRAGRGAPARRAKRSAPARAAAGSRKAAPKARKISPIPPGMHTVTPNLVLSGCAEAMDFYKEAFGAAELMRMVWPGTDRIMHAEMRIGDSVVYMNDAMPGGPMRAPGRDHAATASLALYVEDADALFDRAVKSGASVGMPMADAFWGDRVGMVTDPFGHSWMILTHTRDLSADEIKKGAEDFARKMSQTGSGEAAQGEGAPTHGVPSAGESPQAQPAS